MRRDTRRVCARIGIVVTIVLVGCGLSTAARASVLAADELTISNGAAHDSFGSMIAVDGHTLVISAPARTVGGHANQGALYVYSDAQTGSWQKVATLTASDGTADDLLGDWNPNTQHGVGVAISDNTIVAGVPGRTVTSSKDRGCVYVFTRSGPDPNDWSNASQSQLRAKDAPVGQKCGSATGTTSNSFTGGAVAISGDTLAFAGPHSDGDDGYTGGVYVFTRSKGGWKQQQELVPGSSKTDNSAFGWAIAMSDSTLLVSNVSNGVFVYSSSGGTYSKIATLTPSTDNAYFGESVAVSGHTAVVGAAFDPAVTTSTYGVIYVFNLTAGSSHEVAKLIDPKEAGFNGGNLANAVTTNGSLVVSGAPKQPAKGASQTDFSGMVDIWTKPAGGWASTSHPEELTAPDASTQSLFGSAVALGTDSLFVGAPGHQVATNAGQGAVYLASTAAKVTLTVTKSGKGSGTVTSDPKGIDCGATCRTSFRAGTRVKLTADEKKGSVFAGWSGGVCSGTKTTCSLTMNIARSVTAKFVKR